MSTRSRTSVVEFRHAFALPGCSADFPPGRYEVLVEEELLEGLSFAAYRETGAYLMIHGKGPNAAPTEMRAVSTAFLAMALKHDALLTARDEGAGSAPASDMARPSDGC